MMPACGHFLSTPFAALLQTAESNPRIRQSREAALANLNPSDKQLQHGLELHADALVWLLAALPDGW